MEESKEALERPGAYVHGYGRQAFLGVVALQQRVPRVQGLLRQHVLDVLANVVGSQFFKLEPRVLLGQPALQVAVVAFVVFQCPGLQAFRFLGSEKDVEIIIDWMV